MSSTGFHGSILFHVRGALGTDPTWGLLALSKSSDPVTRPHVLVADREGPPGSNDGVPILVDWDPDTTTTNIADRMDDRHLSGETGDHRGAYAAGVGHLDEVLPFVEAFGADHAQGIISMTVLGRVEHDPVRMGEKIKNTAMLTTFEADRFIPHAQA